MISPISLGTYEMLSKGLANNSDELFPLYMTSEIIHLKNKGFFSENRVVKLVHPQFGRLNDLSSRTLQSIILQITQNCNLRCKYCVYSDEVNLAYRTHSQKRMSYENAVKAINFLYEHSIDSPSINIGFYGGEPLLEFEMIQRLIAYSEQRFRGKKLSFSITTNATLLTEPIYSYLKQHNFLVTISMDGSRKNHNRNRVFAGSGVGSYDTIAKNIEGIRLKHPDIQHELNISAVADPKCGLTSNYVTNKETDIFIDEKNIGITVAEISGEGGIISEEFINSYQYGCFLALRKFYGMLDSNTRIHPLCTQDVRHLYQEFIRLGSNTTLQQQGIPSGPCVPGLSRLFVDIDGKLFPCERVNEQSSCTCIGTVDNGFQFDKIGYLLHMSNEHQEKCKHCVALRHCDICIKLCDGGDGISYQKYTKACSNSIDYLRKRLKYWTLFYTAPHHIYFTSRA